ncbi:MAG: rhomboid family intramembrane serine protease [Chitinispirillaceae bacterium]
MIPVKNEIDRKGIPAVTVLLIISCVLVYFLRKPVVHGNALVPLDFMYSLFNPTEGLTLSLKALFFAFFMHGSLFHLASNLWFMWIFGSAVEKELGHFRFAAVYILSGCVSMLIQVASSPLSDLPIVGASGAIAGLMGVHLVYLPLSRILVFIPPVFLFRIPALLYLLFWFYIQYINLFSPRTAGGGVAWWAHAGGYVFGVLCAFYLKMKNGIKKR